MNTTDHQPTDHQPTDHQSPLADAVAEPRADSPESQEPYPFAGTANLLRCFRLRGDGAFSLDVTVEFDGDDDDDDDELVRGGGERHGEVLVRAHAPDLDHTVEWRPITQAEVDALARWAHDVVNRENPQNSVAAVCLHGCGITLDVVSSDSSDLTVEFTAEDRTSQCGEVDTLLFDTTLMAVRHFACQIEGTSVTKPRQSEIRRVSARGEYGALIWEMIGLEGGSLLNTVCVFDEDRLPPPGNAAMLVTLDFDPDCDAEMELERFRLMTQGALASLLGTGPTGDQFGVLIYQSTPELDMTWEGGNGQDSGAAAPAVSGARGQSLEQWDQFFRGSRNAEIEEVRDWFEEEFGASLRRGANGCEFASLTGAIWLPYAAIAVHLVDGGMMLREAHEIVADRSPVPFREALRMLLAEAVGVPLHRMWEADNCVLPHVEHACTGEPLSDALSGWLAGLLSPEQFTSYLARTAPGPQHDPGPKSYVGQFEAILGNRESAHPDLEPLFAHAEAADRATDDTEEIAAVRQAFLDASSLFVREPSGRHPGLRDLVGELGRVFAAADEDENDDDASEDHE